MRISRFACLFVIPILAALGTSAFAGEVKYNPPVSPNNWKPTAGINAVNNINNPPRTPQQSGAVIDSRVPVQQLKRPLSNSAE